MTRRFVLSGPVCVFLLVVAALASSPNLNALPFPNAGDSAGKHDATASKSPVFLVAPSIAVAGRPAAIVAADLNGDGAPDLVVANAQTGNVDVLHGDGKGKFQAPVHYKVGGSPVALILGDLAGHGKVDIAVADQSGNSVSVLLGKGDGTFQAAVAYAVGSSPVALAVGDFNGDGHPDLLVANAGSNTLAVLANNGDGTFQSAKFYSVTASPVAIAVSDFNGDGKLDVASGNADGTVNVLLGDGTGRLNVAATMTAATRVSALVAGDFNRDGKSDLAVADPVASTVSIFLGRGDGTFQSPSVLPVGNEPVSLALEDVNADGVPDLLGVNKSGNTISVMLGAGDGTFQPSSEYVVGNSPVAVAIADFNGDGHLDLATANAADGSVSVPLGNGDGTFQAAQDYRTHLERKSVAVGDLNGDGHPDVVVASFCGSDLKCAGNGTASVFLSNGKGALKPASIYSLGKGPVSIALADVNGDKKLDLIAVNRDEGTVMVLLGNGDGTFQEGIAYAAGASPVAVSVGDFNKDGKLDLAIASLCGAAGCHQQGSVNILLGNGDGSFKPGPSYDVDFSPTAVTVGDVDGDGKLDLVVANSCGKSAACSNGTASVLLGDGKGNFTFKTDVDLGKQVSSVALADLKGAGKLDLIAANSADNQVGVLLGNGDGTFKSQVPYAVGVGPSGVVVADFDGDGLPDVAVANLKNSTVSLLHGNGDGTLATAVAYAVGLGPDALAALDLTGSGRLALVTANGNSGSSPTGNDVTVLANAGGAGPLAPAPTVTSVDPVGGPLAGGTVVTITGTGFQSGATVTFGGVAATNVTFGSATQITATSPANPAGAVDVVVTNPDAQFGTLTAGYLYANAPTVTSVSPVGGPLAGGTVVTITGTGFQSGATVTFGGVAATSVTFGSATQITATSPAHAAGAVDVVVTNPDTQTGTLTAGYLYANAPTVLSVNPTSGPLAGGTVVTITGTGFQSGATVKFGGVAATNVTFGSATQITATSPAHAAGAVDVVVTNPDTQTGTLTAGYLYASAPTVTSVSPVGGPLAGGTVVTITGTGFQSGATVKFGGVAATSVTFGSATQITATSPAHAAGAVDVVVTNPDTQTGTLTAGYLYANAPTVSSVSPVGGPLAGGTVVTITGTGFQNGATVKFGGVAAIGVTFGSATQITATSPAHAAGAVDVVVTNPDAQTGTLTAGYLYANGPTVTSVSPVGGPLAGGTVVTITGTGFQSGATVKFGGVAATGVTFGSATQITATSPAHAAGAVDVVVTNPDTQTGTLTAGYLYANGPTVTSVSPVGGPLAGGTVVTITGTGFQSGATVKFGGVAATGVTFGSATQITATSPAHAAGAVDVVVTNPDTQTGTLTAGYLYANGPTVTSVSPVGGPLAGGTVVTITGTGFQNGATVKFGGVAAIGVTFGSATQITATSPAHAAGAVDVVVTNPDTQTGTLTAGYLYANAPTVTSVNPVGGPLAGTNTVTITGTGFQTGATVLFGTASATNVTVVSATTITVTAPANPAGAVNVKVTNPDTQFGTLTNGYLYAPAPTVTSVNPSSGVTAEGTAVTIAGTGFQNLATVKFGGTAATNVVVASATQITATSPAHAAGAVDVVVTNPDTQLGTLTNGYTYAVAPTFSKTFGAPTVLLNNSTSLTFMIANSNGVALTGVGFTDSLPSGLVVSTPNGLTGNCGGGTVTAVAGSGSVSLSGGTITANGSCNISVNVTGITGGVQNNVTGTVTSANGGTGLTASASIKVQDFQLPNSLTPISIIQGFSDSTTMVQIQSLGSFASTQIAGTCAPLPAAFTDATCTVNSGNPITLTADGTTAPSVQVTLGPATNHVASTLTPPGPYTLTLTFTDQATGLTHNVPLSVTVVQNIPPTCATTSTTSPFLVVGSDNHTVIATVVCADPENDISTTTVDWGDGSPQQAITSNVPLQHVYAQPTQGIAYAVTAVATDAANLLSNDVSESVTLNPQVPVIPGNSAMVTAPLLPSATFSGTVTFACVSVSTTNGTSTALSDYGLGCTFNPASANLATTNQVQVTVSTKATSSASQRASLQSRRLGAIYALWFGIPGIVFLGLGITAKTQSRRLRLRTLRFFGLWVALSLTLLIVACGGGFTQPGPLPGPGGTPSGVYFLTVDGTDNNGTVQTTIVVEILVGQ